MKTVSVSLAALLLTCGASLAQTAPLTEGHFNALDTDKNGKISKSEYDVFMGQAFDQMDANRDGSLRSKETAKVLTPEQFDTVDTDKDKKVSKDEFLKTVQSDFESNDRDKDGHLAK